MKKAVIDRIHDRKALLLVGEEEKEQLLSIDNLPDGAAEGTWLKIHPDGKIEIDYKETSEVKSRIQDKMMLLRSKQNKSKFSK